jgi:hypothetical protein
MKLFLLTYDRKKGELLGIETFEPGEYEDANRAMLAKERAHPHLEVVLLEAASEDQLRLTHRRYFEGPLLQAS